jgi:hypothetical protein
MLHGRDAILAHDHPARRAIRPAKVKIVPQRVSRRMPKVRRDAEDRLLMAGRNRQIHRRIEIFSVRKATMGKWWESRTRCNGANGPVIVVVAVKTA